MQKIYCRWSQSLGTLEDTHQKVWGTIDYKWWKNRNKPTVFFGLYDLRDYIALWFHKGKSWILWAGSDIRNLRSNFIFNDGKLLWLSKLFSVLILNFRNFLISQIICKSENWVENEAEAWQLKDIGLKVDGICPSFLGDIKKYKVSFKRGNNVYVSCAKGRQREYGFGIIEMIASSLPNIKFHLYGDDLGEYYQPQENIIQHGRISKEKMNKQIKKMQCGLRLNKHDGFSEITAKSILWGQYPITYLYFPYITQYTADDVGYNNTLKSLNNLIKLLKEIPKKRKPNLKARAYYISKLNKYPWCGKIKK